MLQTPMSLCDELVLLLCLLLLLLVLLLLLTFLWTPFSLLVWTSVLPGARSPGLGRGPPRAR